MGLVKTTSLSATEKASKAGTICVSVAQMKDPFFLAMNHGVAEEAKLLGVNVQTLDAGGHDHLADQVSEVETCVAGGADAVAPVATSQDGMGNLMAELKDKPGWRGLRDRFLDSPPHAASQRTV